MQFGEGNRRLLVSIGAVCCLLVTASVAIVVKASASSEQPVRVAALTDISPEVTTTSTTVAPTTTSTSTSTTSTSTSTTSTTVKPQLATTVAPVRTTVATTPPVTAPRAPAPASTSQGDRCRAALQYAADHGVLLPAGWGFRCPGEALVDGADRWGVACWNCEGTGSWIAVDVGRIGSSDAALRYVVTHETCHAIDYTTLGITTEVGADLCAALHGAPRP